jgi:hypothetical protein
MGVKTVKFLVAVCNQCDFTFESPEGGGQVFQTERDCLEAVVAAKWLIHGENLYCPTCYERVGTVQ